VEGKWFDVGKNVDAVGLLEGQHREMEDLFEKLEKASGRDAKRKVFTEIADKLAIHATIEEQDFYPAVKAKRTEDILLESLEEHLGIKRVLADLLAMDVDHETFEAKAKVLKEQVEHHVGEEEDDLFPKVKKLLDTETLIAIAQQMTATQEELVAKGSPRKAVPSETKRAGAI
jgi:hemerythrin superfamily protein